MNLQENPITAGLITAAGRLRDDAGALVFPPPAARVYNPLDYAWEPHRDYIKKYAGGEKRVLFLGMNPGPWGMAQTGVPFGEVEAVRNWLGIEGKVGQPPEAHPKRPVQGFGCPKSEVSGRRLWGLMRERFGDPENFFREHWVANYCPLVFMLESGANYTPDKFPPEARRELYEVCDLHLIRTVEILQPEYLVGIGKFAGDRFGDLKKAGAFDKLPKEPRVSWILHPSPASPAANRGWADAAAAQLTQQGVW